MRKQISNEAALFFKDDYKLSKNLTLNLGVRYDWYGVPFSPVGLTATGIGGGGAAFGVSGRDFSGWMNPGLRADQTVFQFVGKNSPEAGKAAGSFEIMLPMGKAVKNKTLTTAKSMRDSARADKRWRLVEDSKQTKQIPERPTRTSRRALAIHTRRALWIVSRQVRPLQNAIANRLGERIAIVRKVLKISLTY